MCLAPTDGVVFNVRVTARLDAGRGFRDRPPEGARTTRALLIGSRSRAVGPPLSRRQLGVLRIGVNFCEGLRLGQLRTANAKLPGKLFEFFQRIVLDTLGLVFSFVVIERPLLADLPELADRRALPIRTTATTF